MFPVLVLCPPTVRALMPALASSPWVGHLPVTLSFYCTFVECSAQWFVHSPILEILIGLLGLGSGILHLRRNQDISLDTLRKCAPAKHLLVNSLIDFQGIISSKYPTIATEVCLRAIYAADLEHILNML